MSSAALLVSAVPAFADPSSISAKEAEVQSVLNQIEQLDGSPVSYTHLTLPTNREV